MRSKQDAIGSLSKLKISIKFQISVDQIRIRIECAYISKVMSLKEFAETQVLGKNGTLSIDK